MFPGAARKVDLFQPPLKGEMQKTGVCGIRLIWLYRKLKNLNGHQMHVEIVGLEDTYFVKSQKGKFSKKSEIFEKYLWLSVS